MTESVVGCVDGVERLARVFLPLLGLRQIRKVGNDEVDGSGDGLEQIPAHDMHAIGDAVPFGIRARELDRSFARVRRPDLDLGSRNRDRDADHAGAGADVRDSHRPRTDLVQRRVHERLSRASRREHAAGRGEECESVKGDFHENAIVADWAQHFRREEERYRDGDERLPHAEDADACQRQLTRMGNAAAGAGLSLVMQGNRTDAHAWFDRACTRYRESWEHAPPGSWGRPVAILKARILDRDWSAAEHDAAWTLEVGAGDSESAIGRYAAVLALAVLSEWQAMRGLSARLQDAEGFPNDVGTALAAVAADDPDGYAAAIGSVLDSFETRDAFLEDLPVADTVVVLQLLAERRGLAPVELESELLPG